MSRSQPLSCPSLLWFALFVAALVFAAPGETKQDPHFPGVASGVPMITLSNGKGDGSARVTVDPTGFFGASTGGLIFNPAGPIPESDTVFYSGLWFSGADRAGQAGGTFLGDNTNLGGSFVEVKGSRAVSRFTIDGLDFRVEQQLLPPTSTGTLFRQVYTIQHSSDNANTQGGTTTSFDLLRHFDGDLTFDNSIDDVAARAPGGQQLYELDSNDDPQSPVTFLGIDLQGQADLGNRIAEFSFTSDIFQQGRGVLNGTITRDGPGGENTENADQNNDGFTDDPYDVTLTLGQTFQLPFGQKVTFSTNTLLGRGAPGGIFGAPTQLTATLQNGKSALLEWRDNSDGETGFEIQRRTGEGNFVHRARTLENVTQFTDGNLAQNTVYAYRVRAEMGKGGVTEFSNEASVDTSGGQDEAPRFIAPTPKNGTRFRVEPGEKLHFAVRASDPDSSLVTLTADGIPFGAIVTPTLPAAGNPVDASFSWTPTKADEGIYDLTFTADGVHTPESSQGTTRQFRILVGKVGVCVRGEVGESKALRIDGLAGYPRGGKKFIGRLTMKLKPDGKTFKSTEITRFRLVGKTVSMEGVGTVNGRGSHRFILQAEDNGPRPRDRILNVTVDAASWPSGSMRSGAGVLQHLP